MFTVLLISIIAITGSQAQECFTLAPAIHPKEELSVREAFYKYKIVGDYLPEPPNDLLAGGHGVYEIKLGTILNPFSTLSPLYLSYPNGKFGEKYTALLISIAQPSRNVCHTDVRISGLIVNSPADDIMKGNAVVPLNPPIPMPDTGVHRYVGLLFKQNGIMDVEDISLLKLAQQRDGFSVTDFADKYGLGAPLAGNFFFSSFPTCGSK